ncbi:MAG: hypothetical protein HGA31_02055 [Candidatus Moranbacteria bacterium]|nr:hypothetical protein [Candidatus Moranbacteria bacterium]
MGKISAALGRLMSFGKKGNDERLLCGFDRLSEMQIRYVLDVIDQEIRKSGNFGLVLRSEDEYREKVTVLTIFDHFGQSLNDKGEILSGSEYEAAMRDVSVMAYEILKDQLARYFDETPEGGTRNRYACHVESVMSRLSRDFLDKRCVSSMK